MAIRLVKMGATKQKKKSLVILFYVYTKRTFCVVHLLWLARSFFIPSQMERNRLKQNGFLLAALESHLNRTKTSPILSVAVCP